MTPIFAAIFALAFDAHAACVPPDLQRVAEQVKGLAREEAFEDALRLFDHAHEQLPCLDGPVDRLELVRLLQAAGEAARLSGDIDGAERLWQRALRLAPGQSLYQPIAQVHYLHYDEQRALLDQSPRSVVRAGGAVILDGEQVACGASTEVLPGEHFVQWVASDDTLVSRWEPVYGFEPVVVGPDLELTCADAGSASRSASTNRPRWAWLGVGGSMVLVGGGVVATGALWTYDGFENAAAGSTAKKQYAALTTGLIGGGTTLMVLGSGFIGHALDGRQSVSFHAPLVFGRW